MSVLRTSYPPPVTTKRPPPNARVPSVSTRMPSAAEEPPAFRLSVPCDTMIGRCSPAARQARHRRQRHPPGWCRHCRCCRRWSPTGCCPAASDGQLAPASFCSPAVHRRLPTSTMVPPLQTTLSWLSSSASCSVPPDSAKGPDAVGQAVQRVAAARMRDRRLAAESITAWPGIRERCRRSIPPGHRSRRTGRSSRSRPPAGRD